jgi:hypothetical protein
MHWRQPKYRYLSPWCRIHNTRCLSFAAPTVSTSFRPAARFAKPAKGIVSEVEEVRANRSAANEGGESSGRAGLNDKVR